MAHDGWERAKTIGSVVMMAGGVAVGLIKLGMVIGTMQMQPRLEAAQSRVRQVEDALRRAVERRRGRDDTRDGR